MSTLPRAGVKSDFRRFEELAYYFNEAKDELIELTAALQTQIDELIEITATLQTQIDERSQYGVVTGLVTTAQDEPDMSVNVSEGIIYMANGDRFEVEADTMALIEADVDNPRIDIIYINGIGLVSYYPGTAAEVPEAPETPLGSQLLAEIAVAANATTIEAANITDERKIITN